ncbi:MAG: DUF1430 domain-containing protein [Clostridium sp.]
MKKFIVALLLGISMITFFILYNDYRETYVFNLKNIENHLSKTSSIIIPTKINSLPRNNQYDKLKESSNEKDVSMYFSRIDQDGNKEKIIKYIYTTNNEYVDKLTLVKGKKLDYKYMNTNYFLSTKDTGDPNQIGQIASFDGVEMEVHTLRTMLDKGYILDGPCIISAPERSLIDSFLNVFKVGLDIGIIEESKPSDIGEIPSVKYYQIAALYVVFLLVMLYDILKSYKKIAVKKMLGYSTMDIWKKTIGLILIIQITTIGISSIIMSLILFDDINILYINFMKDLVIKYSYLVGVTFIVASLPFIYVQSIKVVSIVKNSKQTKGLIIFNNLVKVFLCVAVIFLINQQIDNYQNIKKAFDGSYKRWTSVNTYKVLSLNRSDNDGNEFLNNSSEIYKQFNKKGAIFADFTNYTELSKQFNKDVPMEHTFSLVNPNYLKENPSYDTKGKRVSVSENNKNWVLLVPDKYKKNEKSIRDYYDIYMRSFGPSYKAKLEIIWTKSNQKYFSYNFSVNANDGNYVKDPILFVGTESGGFPLWSAQVFNVAGNPLKVKVNTGGDYKSEILSVLSKYGYDSYGVQINYADEQVATSTKNYKDMFKWIVTGILFCIVIIAILIIQNIYNFFEEYKVKWALRQLHGYGIVEKYIEYFAIICVSWGVVIAISLGIMLWSYKVVLTIALIGFIVEVLISVIILTIHQNRNIVKLIKGGI